MEAGSDQVLLFFNSACILHRQFILATLLMDPILELWQQPNRALNANNLLTCKARTFDLLPKLACRVEEGRTQMVASMNRVSMLTVNQISVNHGLKFRVIESIEPKTGQHGRKSRDCGAQYAAVLLHHSRALAKCLQPIAEVGEMVKR